MDDKRAGIILMMIRCDETMFIRGDIVLCGDCYSVYSLFDRCLHMSDTLNFRVLMMFEISLR